MSASGQIADDGPERGLLTVVSGPSGVGKGTVIRRAVAALPDAVVSVSATTRPPRAQERDGVDYHFVDDATFDAMVADGELLEWATFAGHRYGTPRRWVDEQVAAARVVVLEIDVQGALQVRAREPQAYLLFLAPPSLAALEQRLRGRGTETDEVRSRRLAAARDELAQQDAFDDVVVNDDLERCVAEVTAQIGSRRQVSAGSDPGP